MRVRQRDILQLLGRRNEAGCVYRRAIDALGPLTADRAVALLGRAVEKGFADAAWLRRHPPLAPLRDREDFQALVKKVEAAGKK